VTNIAIFASGTGSNAQKIMEYFNRHPQIRVALVLSNNSQAGVFSLAQQYHVPALTFTRTQFYETKQVIHILQEYTIEWIVLAGFLWLIPADLIRHFPDKILNIHPALLPKYGGKGMYGARVHQAVVEAGETSTGITIHLVNEVYDQGKIIFQAACEVTPKDTPEEVAHKVQALEHAHFASVIEKLILKYPL
jgi:phosphoribosylglycinamide formyltransferase-1